MNTLHSDYFIDVTPDHGTGDLNVVLTPWGYDPARWGAVHFLAFDKGGKRWSVYDVGLGGDPIAVLYDLSKTEMTAVLYYLAAVEADAITHATGWTRRDAMAALANGAAAVRPAPRSNVALYVEP